MNLAEIGRVLLPLRLQPGLSILMHDELCILSGRANPKLAAEIASWLNIGLGSVSLENFPDGEIAVRLDTNVRGRDVFLVQAHRSTG